MGIGSDRGQLTDRYFKPEGTYKGKFWAVGNVILFFAWVGWIFASTVQLALEFRGGDTWAFSTSATGVLMGLACLFGTVSTLWRESHWSYSWNAQGFQAYEYQHLRFDLNWDSIAKCEPLGQKVFRFTAEREYDIQIVGAEVAAALSHYLGNKLKEEPPPKGLASPKGDAKAIRAFCVVGLVGLGLLAVGFSQNFLVREATPGRFQSVDAQVLSAKVRRINSKRSETEISYKYDFGRLHHIGKDTVSGDKSQVTSVETFVNAAEPSVSFLRLIDPDHIHFLEAFLTLLTVVLALAWRHASHRLKAPN